jgi:transcriptional regulator with XRE-family HTH domain
MAGISIVAKHLKEARLRAGLSQKQLGIKAGIDQYERGKHMPDLQTLTRLAAVMHVPAPYFYCEDVELAGFILKFSALGKAQKKRLLSSMDEL